MTDLFEYSPERAAKLSIWKRNRDHLRGSDAVKRAKYLPRGDIASNEEYNEFCRTTPYFAAAARTLESFTGLVFRKSPKVVAPDDILAIAPVITSNGESLESVAKWAFREYLTTNDGGLLVDHPEAPNGLTKAQASALDIRPYIAPYAAEAILELQFGVIMGRRRLMKVRLLESPTVMRQLELVDGAYRITIFNKDGGATVEVASITPLRDGKPLDSIPFVYLGDSEPTAPFDELCAKNEDHYFAMGKLALASEWIVRPVVLTTGVQDDVQLEIKNGSHWNLKHADADAKWLEYDSDGIPCLERQVDRLAKELEVLGSRMLSSEKASTASESSETIARRNAGEESLIGSLAAHVSSKTTDAVKHFTDWVGSDSTSVRVQLNTDFVPTPLQPAMLTQIAALNTSGLLPDRATFDLLQAGEMLGAEWDYETWAAARDTGLSS